MRSTLFGVALLLTSGFCQTDRLTAADPVRFVVHSINPESTFDSCAVFDVDGDGRRDIVCGGWWYQAPSWKKHYLRDVEVIRGRFDDYSALPMDVNQDGHTDLISANYRSQTLYWVEHPGVQLKSGTAWQRHVIAEPGAMETGRLFDVDGDGRPDIVPNGVKFAAWWNVQPGNSPVWTRYSLPEQLAGHGIGCGDINGDGRADLVGRFGWAEAPEDRRGGRWVFHDDFLIERDAGIPILVLDVDQDGDADLVWGRGHRIGLHWLEQKLDSDGSRNWQRHAIDTSWSQAHSLLLADLDGDGHSELIAGKRFMGHDGKDPGEYDPLVSYCYQFQPSKRTWNRQRLHFGGAAGYGLDPKAEDLDHDGDVDLIVADRNGLHWLENVTHAPGRTPSPASEDQFGSETSEAAEAPFEPYSDHSNVLVYRDEQGKMQPVETPFQMAIRRSHILQGMSLAMGPMPTPDRRVPLDVQILSDEDAGKYIRRRISYVPEPGDRVPAWLLIPKQPEGKSAAMLCLHQTTGIGKGEPAGLGGLPNLHYAHELAERGFVCLVPDYPSFGDYEFNFRTQGSHYGSGSMKAIWNNVRAIDLLETLPEVDSDRIGCIGHSLGGHNTLFTAAFDVRIRASVTSCGFTAFHHYYDGNLAGWTSDRYMPRIRDDYGNNPDRVPFDFYEVLAAIAPRSIYINAPIGDSNFENTGIRKVVGEVSRAYGAYGSDPQQRLIARYPDCGHDFPVEMREEAYAWLKEQLKNP